MWQISTDCQRINTRRGRHGRELTPIHLKLYIITAKVVIVYTYFFHFLICLDKVTFI